MDEYCSLVWRILSSMPIEVFDDESSSVLHSETWELVTPRTEGEYAGTRTIGTANIVSAYNLLHLKMLASSTTRERDFLSEFRVVLNSLADQKLIRRRPDLVRAGFRTV